VDVRGGVTAHIRDTLGMCIISLSQAGDGVAGLHVHFGEEQL